MSEERRPDDLPIDPTVNPLSAGAPGTSAEPKIFVVKPPEESGMPLKAWLIAGIAVLVVLGGLIFAGRHKQAPTNAVQPLAAYAGNLQISQPVMSESTSLSGGKSTFIDGHIKNIGTQTVTGITVQVFFRNDEQLPPQIETLPLSLIRTREPYIDTEPVSAEPLKPGDEHDFRLIFESIPTNWNMQMPEIHVVGVQAK